MSKSTRDERDLYHREKEREKKSERERECEGVNKIKTIEVEERECSRARRQTKRWGERKRWGETKRKRQNETERQRQRDRETERRRDRQKNSLVGSVRTCRILCMRKGLLRCVVRCSFLFLWIGRFRYGLNHFLASRSIFSCDGVYQHTHQLS